MMNTEYMFRSRKHILAAALALLTFAAVLLAFPSVAEAETSVILGETVVSWQNDGSWHNYAGGGRYKVSTDGSTLYLDGIRQQGSQGLSVTGDIKLVLAGDNTIKCTSAGQQGIYSYAVYVDGNLDISGSGSLTATSVSPSAAYITGMLKYDSSGSFTVSNSGSSMSLYAKQLITYGGKISINNTSTGEDRLAFSAETVQIDRGTVSANGNIYIDNTYLQRGGTLETAKRITANGMLTCTGGKITYADELHSNDILTIMNDSSVKAGLIESDKSVSISNTASVTANLIKSGSGITVSGGPSVTASFEAADSITVSGSGKIIASGGNSSAIKTGGSLIISGGTVEASNNITDFGAVNQKSCIYVASLRMTGGKISAVAKGNGGSAVYITGNSTVSGGELKGTAEGSENKSDAIHFEGKLTITGGTIEGKGIDGSAVYFKDADARNCTITGSVTGETHSRMGVAGGALNVNTGTVVTGTSVYESGVYISNLNVFDGILNASSKRGMALRVNDLHIEGGKLTAQTDSDNNYGLMIYGSAPELTNGVWISNPNDGYFGADPSNASFKYVMDGNSGKPSKTVCLQKTSSISVKKAPTAVLREGDVFDPAGLVLKLTFADGSDSELSYNDIHKDMFSFSPSDAQLSAGSNSIGITCLTKKTSVNVTAKEFGPPELRGEASQSSVSLNWTAVEGAEKYEIYAGSNENQLSYAAMVTGTSFTDSSIRPGQLKYYQLRAVRTNNKGNTYVSPSSKIRLTRTLAAPEIELTSAGYDSAVLSWNAVEGADSYEIYRAEMSDPDDFSLVKTTSECSISDDSLITGITYTYYVKAVNSVSGAKSAEINSIDMTPEFTGSTVLEAVNNGEGYGLSWDAVAGATGYEVYRGEGEITDAEQLTLLDETASTAYTDEEADPYLVYSYMIKPKRDIGSRVFYADSSNIAAGEAMERPPEPEPEPEAEPKPEPVPPAPQIVTPTSDDPAGTVYNLLQAKATKAAKTYVKIGWKAVPGAKFYMVYGNKCGNQNRYMKLTTTDATSMIYDTVAGSKIRKGTYYKFLIYAIDSNNEVISTSKTIHVATAGGKVGNDRKVITAAKKNKVSLKKGGKFKLRAKAVPASKKLKVKRHRRIAYESSDPKVASVTSKGVIKGTGKGKCFVYAYTQNGVCARIRVSVN